MTDILPQKDKKKKLDAEEKNNLRTSTKTFFKTWISYFFSGKNPLNIEYFYHTYENRAAGTYEDLRTIPKHILPD